MNDIAMKPVPVEAGGGDIEIVFDATTALAVLTDEQRFDEFYAKVEAEVSKVGTDVSTAKARDEIRAAAHKVARTKTAIDKAGLGLTEEWRRNTAKVNDARSAIKTRLDALRDQVRKPLTDWEAAEAAREADVKAKLQDIEDSAVVSLEDTVETVELRLQRIGGIEITDDHFGDYAAAARAQRERTLETLRAAVARLRKEAEERAELEKLRAEKAKREYADSIMAHIREVGAGRIGGQAYPFPILFRELEEKVVIDEQLGDLQEDARKLRDETLTSLRAWQERDRAEAEAKEAAEREQRQREEQERQAKAQADAAAKAAEEAAAKARREAEAQARAEREERDRAAQAKLDEERRAKEAAEAEAKRLADEKAAAEAKAAAEKAEADKRAADREHRGQVMGHAKAAIMAAGGVGEEAAKKIVLAIVAGEVPAVTLTF